MNGTKALLEHQTMAKAGELFTDQVIAGGWDAVIERIRLTSIRLIELAANIHAHRKPAMTMLERRDSGLLSLDLFVEIDDFVNLVSGFRPPKRSSFELIHSEFSSPFDSVRKEFPSHKLLTSHIESIEGALNKTVDAVQVMTERPGMPIPTFEQLATGYIEIARLQGIQTAVETAASCELTSGSTTDVDLFGVGIAAPIINRIIPPRCVPGNGKITLPKQISIDTVVAAHLLERFVMDAHVHFDCQADDTFDAAATHTSNHATVAVGFNHFHSPNQLCFDDRALEQPTTNTELVIAHAIELGTPLDFTDGMVRFAQGDVANEHQFEADMINTFHEVCGSTSLAMRATNLLLTNRFKTSDKFKEWCRKRNMAYLESLPEYQKYAPKIEEGMKPMPGIPGLSAPLPE